MEDSLTTRSARPPRAAVELGRQAKETNMKTELRQGEQIVKEGAANLQKNIETVGGKLCLTNQRLVFEAHKINH